MEMQRMSNYFFSCSSFVSLVPTLFDFGSFMSRTHFNRSWWCVCHDLPRQSSQTLLICAYQAVVNSRFIQGSNFMAFVGF
jgi:hypothetical protein